MFLYGNFPSGPGFYFQILVLELSNGKAANDEVTPAAAEANNLVV